MEKIIIVFNFFRGERNRVRIDFWLDNFIRVGYYFFVVDLFVKLGFGSEYGQISLFEPGDKVINVTYK